MTRRKVLWTRSARRDLEAIVSYLADRSPQAALSTLDRLEARAKSLATLADRGRVVPELARLHVREYRELVVPPHRIVYRIAGNRVLVLAALDARRSLEDVLLDRLIRLEDPGRQSGK
jgi:plasmid stabilization system protein ParE